MGFLVLKVKYMGSKSRIAKHIVPIIQKYIDDNNAKYYYEPFLGGANKKLLINGKGIFAWESPVGKYTQYRYKDLLTYLCDCLGVSTPKNVCACAVDLAKYNNMSLGELFSKYQGN